MIRPTVYGQIIIILVYVPLLAFTGVEGKTFEPMALTVMIALAAAFVVSLTFVPAAIAIAITTPVSETENVIIRRLKQAYTTSLTSRKDGHGQARKSLHILNNLLPFTNRLDIPT
jgi:cobalt-zinc-cadmium resistance protein CzcA